MGKGLVYVIEIEGIKLRHCCAVQTLIVQEHLPHLADWVSRIYGCCALQLANLQEFECYASAPKSTQPLVQLWKATYGCLFSLGWLKSLLDHKS